MAAGDKKAKAKEDAPKEKASVDAPAKDKAAEAAPAADVKAEAPKNYSRGEGQKTVTQAYKDNWNVIYGKKKR